MKKSTREVHGKYTVKKKEKIMELVYLEWEDAIANSSWHTQEALDRWVSEDNTIIQEVGWVYKETKNYIVLVGKLSSYYDHSKTDRDYGSLQKIPKTWIRKKKILKI